MVSYEFLQSRANLNARQEKEAAYLLSNIPTDSTQLQTEIDITRQERDQLGNNYDGGLHGDAAARYTVVERRLGLLEDIQARGVSQEQLSAQNQILTSQRNATLNTLRAGPSSSRAAVGGGVLGGGGRAGERVVSTSSYEDNVRAGYTGGATVDPRVSDIFKVPESGGLYGVTPSPTRSSSSGPLPAALPQSSVIKTIDPTKVGAKAGVKSVIPPIQNRSLMGTTITARQLKDIQGGKIPDPLAPSGRQSTKVLPDVLPSSRTSAFIPGVNKPFPNLLPIASAEPSGKPVAPKAPTPPRQVTQDQVNKMSDAEYRRYAASIDKYEKDYANYEQRYNQYASQIQSLNRERTIQAGQSNIQARNEIKNIISDLKTAGNKTVNVITDTGVREVPIGFAYREAIKAGQGLKAIGPSAINLPSGVLAGSLTKFPESLAILPERITQIGPKKEELGPNLGVFTPISKAAIATFELGKPIEQRSTAPLYKAPGITGPSAQDIGKFAAPFQVLGGAFYDLGRATGATIQGKDIGQFKSDFGTEVPRTPFTDLLAGKPVNLLSEKEQPYLAGELALGAATFGVGKVLEIGISATRGKIGTFKSKQEAKAVGKGLARQSDAPSQIKQVQPKVFEFEQGVEPVRSSATKISAKADPILRLYREGTEIGKGIVTGKFTRVPKETKIPPAAKVPDARTPYAYIETGKSGTTAEVLSKPITGKKDEIGAIIRGSLSREEVKRLKATRVSEPEAAIDIYTIKAEEGISNVLKQAEKSGFLKRVTDIRLTPTQEAARTARRGEFSFYEKRIKQPTTIGYYETLGEFRRKTTQTTGYQTPLGSKGLNQLLSRVGLSTAEARGLRSYRQMRPFDNIKIGSGPAGGKGKAQAITKQDENILKDILPKIASPKKQKPRQDAFGDLDKIFPYAGSGFAEEIQAQSRLEPEGVSRGRPTSFIDMQFKNLAGVGITEKESKEINKKLIPSIATRPLVNLINTNIQKPKQETPQKSRVGVVPAVISITGQTSRQTPITGTKQIPIQKTETVPKLDVPEIVIPKVPFEPPLRTPPGKGFGGRPLGFLIPGGRGSGLGSKRGFTKKLFVAEPVDPLRAGVFMAEGVEQLRSSNASVFEQIDINLAKARRSPFASTGLQGSGKPFDIYGSQPKKGKGKKSKNLLGFDVNINI